MKRRRILRALFLTLPLCSSACFTPPVVLEAGQRTIDCEDCLYPADTELVELEVEPGEAVRGVFVPSDACAPVVLYLLEARGSASGEELRINDPRGLSISFSWPRTAPRDLASLGFATLIVDYRGVGPSDGERSARNLPADLEAMWAYAVQRAGGDPRRVFLRGTSLGSLAAAWLLDHGARPGGVVLIAPIRDDSVVRHFAADAYGDLVGLLASSLFKPVLDVDIAQAIGASPSPVAVWSSPEDELLPPDEHAALRAAVRDAGQQWDDHAAGPCGFDARPLQHVRIAMDSRSLMPGERAFWERVRPDDLPIAERVQRTLAELPAQDAAAFPAGSPQRERLGALLAEQESGPPALMAGLALTDNSIPDDLVLLSRVLGDKGVMALDMRRCAEVFELADPDGPVPLSQIARYSRWFLRGGHADDAAALQSVLALAAGMAEDASTRRLAVRNDHGGNDTVTFDLYRSLWKPLYSERGLTPQAAARQALRVLLKNALLPDRVVTGDDGVAQIEVRIDGAWRRVDCGIVLRPR